MDLSRGEGKKWVPMLQVEMYIFTASNGIPHGKKLNWKRYFRDRQCCELECGKHSILYFKNSYQSTVQGTQRESYNFEYWSQVWVDRRVELNVIQILEWKGILVFIFNFFGQRNFGKSESSKVDEYLSFASVVLNVKAELWKQDKIRVDSISSAAGLLGHRPMENCGSSLERQDQKLGVGDNAKEWIPAKAPNFGLVGVGLEWDLILWMRILVQRGLLKFQVSLFLRFQCMGEMWLNTRWFVSGRLRQFVTNQPNPLSGSNPSSFEYLDTDDGAFTEDIIFNCGRFFGPKIQLKVFLSWKCDGRYFHSFGLHFDRLFCDELLLWRKFSWDQSIPIFWGLNWFIHGNRVWQKRLRLREPVRRIRWWDLMPMACMCTLKVCALRGQVDFNWPAPAFQEQVRTSSASSISLKTNPRSRQV